MQCVKENVMYNICRKACYGGQHDGMDNTFPFGRCTGCNNHNSRSDIDRIMGEHLHPIELIVSRPLLQGALL
jgi:hypothetical protein